MDPLGLGLLVAALVGATAFGLWRRRTDGRMRTVESPRAAGLPVPDADDAPPGDLGPDEAHRDGVLSAVDLGAELGERATLVQFSSAFCQPCRATRVVLGEVSGMVEGVAHIEVDAEAHLDLVRRLDITRTPTVFVLDPGGHIVRRAAGAPRKADVIAALGELLD